MRVLVGCEYSGRVRNAFSALGHDAWSCDFLPSESDGNHYQGDVRDLIYNQYWDLAVFHPECTFLTLACAGWYYHPEDKELPVRERRPHPKYPNRRADQEKAMNFFVELQNAPIEKICVENPQPLGVVMKKVGKYTQAVQPWMFGHGETKRTCLWLKGLPELQPTNIVDGRVQRLHYLSPGPNRWKERSRTYEGIANAMAQQWGNISAKKEEQNDVY